MYGYWLFLRQSQMNIAGSKSLSIHPEPRGLPGSSFALRVDGMFRCSSAWMECFQSAAKILTLLAKNKRTSAKGKAG